jgi:hypothetical protein
MPSREPTYYRWSQDKPCTTNQTYGYGLSTTSTGTGCNGTNNTRNKSCTNGGTSGSGGGGGGTAHDKELLEHELSQRKQFGYGSEVQCKPINKGYTMGHVPITKKTAGNKGVVTGVQLQPTIVTPSSYMYPQSRGKDVYLWHTLSGNLVHC